MIGILDGQVELAVMVLVDAAVFSAAIGEDTLQWNPMIFEERQNTIVEHVGSDQGILSVVEFGRGQFGVHVDEGLLIDASNALERPDIERILGPQIAGRLGLRADTTCQG